MSAALTAALAVGALLGACTASSGAACRVDSDCDAGLVCALDGVCRSLAQVSASFDVAVTVDVISFDTSVADAAAGDTDGCRAVTGVFEAATPPCPAAAEVHVVDNLVIAAEGHGLAPLAEVGNQLITAGFADGSITLALHVDGELRGACPRALAWIRGPDDRAADCTAAFTDRMPFDIPNLVSTTVDFASFDPETRILTGLVDKVALLESLDPALRDVADGLILLDVDTDDDGEPDMASAIIEVVLAD